MAFRSNVYVKSFVPCFRGHVKLSISKLSETVMTVLIGKVHALKYSDYWAEVRWQSLRAKLNLQPYFRRLVITQVNDTIEILRYMLG